MRDNIAKIIKSTLPDRKKTGKGNKRATSLDKKEKVRFYLKKAAKIGAILAGIGVLFVGGLFLYYMKDLPNPGKVNKRIVAESTKIFDRTGEHLLYEVHGEERRTIISYDQMPDTIKYATITLEDQGFYHHHGIDFRGIMRAALSDVLNRSKAQGGSTITQQFIKNSILTTEKKYSRKIKEIILAIEIEQKFSKDEILQMYLNEIPYGSNAYGVEAAAQTFFGKPAKELTLAQSALLACLPNAPTYYSPHGSHTDRLLVRWNYTLDEMANLGYITKEQAEQAKSEDILSQIIPFRANIKAPHFVMYVKDQLVDEFGEEEVEKGGLKVYTTLDWRLQEIAEKAVKDGVDKNGNRYNFSNAALVSVNPRNGQILAMVGSKDYFDESIDGNVNVAIRDRQPGSSFKPYVYAMAFEKGYTPDTIIYDVDTKFSTDTENDYNPKNYDNKNRGPLKMKEALSMSLNVPAVKILYLASVKDSINLAKSMGITTLNQPERYGLALVLGGGEVKLVDHVSAFAVFANQGIRHDKTSILKIEDPEGKVLKTYEESEGKQVLDKNVALQITDILSDNDLRSPVFGSHSPLYIPGKKVAAKTGTTNEWRDGWLVGSTPSIAAGVWTGNNDNTPMSQGADGSYTAGPIWNAFMAEALKDTKNEEFEKPEEVETGKDILDGKLEAEEEVEVCEMENGDYCLESSDCPDETKKKRTVFNSHSILYYVSKDDPRGDKPKDPENDPQFKAWEKAVEKWAEDKAGKKDLVEKPEDKCKKDDFDDKYFANLDVRLASPSNGATMKDSKLRIEADFSSDSKPNQVDFFVDGDAIGSKGSGPYSIEYNLPQSLNNKEIEVRVKAYDKYGNKDEDSVRIKLQFAN